MLEQESTVLVRNEPLLVRQIARRGSSAYEKPETIGEPLGHHEPASSSSLTSSSRVFSPFLQLAASQRSLRQWETLKFPGSGLKVYEPAVPMMEWRSDRATIHCLADHLKSFPFFFSREARMPFIHSELYSHWLPNQVKDTYAICRSFS